MASIPARDRLIVALDLPSVAAARAFVAKAGPAVTFYKIGLELVMTGGLELARELAGQGKQVFLDMKLLDIGNTVERATRSAAGTGATFLTVHGHDSKTLGAAVAGKAGTGLKILAVTVLTNLDAGDLAEQGQAGGVEDLVARRAKIARAAGCDGVVASGLEAAQVRDAVGPGIAIVTPGIRLPTDAAGDQSRIATPQVAIAAGADFIVVGRPITSAPDPGKAAEDFVQAIEEALAMRSLGPPG
ncbi:MAG: orotidine-5'-phosphate decarboxylase [Hyphomonadaceae bacterium]|nr:orotidine-5'-phosphate decarboxylase [Hyphomonadaceae bacterium]